MATFTYSQEADAPALSVIDDIHFLCAFDGWLWDGFAVVLEVNTELRP